MQWIGSFLQINVCKYLPFTLSFGLGNSHLIVVCGGLGEEEESLVSLSLSFDCRCSNWLNSYKCKLNIERHTFTLKYATQFKELYNLLSECGVKNIVL